MWDIKLSTSAFEMRPQIQNLSTCRRVTAILLEKLNFGLNVKNVFSIKTYNLTLVSKTQILTLGPKFHVSNKMAVTPRLLDQFWIGSRILKALVVVHLLSLVPGVLKHFLKERIFGFRSTLWTFAPGGRLSAELY